MTRRLGLSALVHGSGGHIAGWRHPEAHPSGQLDVDFHADLAATLERGRFDVLFLADVVAVWGHQLDSLSRTGRAEHFEPLTLLAALSARTSRIGLVATATTTYNEPEQLAARFGALDHVSGGRAGWNVVTSVVPLEAANFGRDEHLEHGLRYERAERVVTELRRRWADEPTSAQGHPVLFQAGSSEVGRAFAARHGDVLFTAQADADACREFRDDLRARAAAAGRDPDRIRVWPSLSPLVAGTEAEAKAKVAELDALVHDDVARRLVQDNIGDLDLSDHPVDGPLPDIPESNRSKSRRDLLLGLARRENLTIRGLAHRFSGGSIVAGTPEQIADRMGEWFTTGAADGFTVSFPYFPGPAVDFVEQVVPLLRKRGWVEEDYEGTTLRENLGLES